jgi:hypothetical protein
VPGGLDCVAEAGRLHADPAPVEEREDVGERRQARLGAELRRLERGGGARELP